MSDGEYSGLHVAIKRLKMNEGDSDRSFEVPSFSSARRNHSVSTQRFCREIIGWKYLSHPNILPLLGVSVSADPHCFRILTEWMPGGNVVQYAKSNPEANRLGLVSVYSFPRVSCIYQRPVALRGHVWCDPSSRAQDRSRGSQRSKPCVVDPSFALLTSEAGKHPRRQHRRRSCCGFWTHGHG